MAPPTDRDRPDGARPKPRWNFERCQHADSACKNRPANAEREQQEFEFYRLAVFVLSGGAGHCARALVRQDRQQTFHGGSIGQVPKIEERLAFDFAAEQGAHARSSEPDGVAGAAVERQDKRIGQHGANGAGLDVRAFRGWAGPTLFLPVSVKLAACGVFHDNRFPARNTSVPDWDKSPRVTGVQLRVEQALCREVGRAGPCRGNAPLSLTKG